MPRHSDIIYQLEGPVWAVKQLVLPAAVLAFAVSQFLIRKSERLVYSITDLRFFGRGGDEAETRRVLHWCAFGGLVVSCGFGVLAAFSIADWYRLRSAHRSVVCGVITGSSNVGLGARGGGSFVVRGITFSFSSTSTAAGYDQESSRAPVKNGDEVTVSYVPDDDKGNPIVKLASGCAKTGRP